MEKDTLTSRFARSEWERRFLLEQLPADTFTADVRQILDRYIAGTRLRLRRTRDAHGTLAFKLTQKLDDTAHGALQGQLTTIYLVEEEYKVLENLPASNLEKTRYSIPPFGIDVFEGKLAGLVLAEAEFSSAEEAAALDLPAFLSEEVTSDRRFTGGSLAAVGRRQLTELLREFGINLSPD
jgi:CYTH domain-containing protein